MALSKIVKINDKLSWSLWKIDAEWQAMLGERNFTSDVIEALEGISHPQKKAEFLASRLALYALLDAADVDQYEIIKDMHGKPFIKHSDVHISIANSYPYAVAIIDLEKPTGIDIEPPSDKLIRVQHKFLHDQELDYFTNHKERLCLAWCAKESLYKLYGRKNLSFKQHILIDTMMYPHQLTFDARVYYQDFFSSHRLQIEHEDNFLITFCL